MLFRPSKPPWRVLERDLETEKESSLFSFFSKDPSARIFSGRLKNLMSSVSCLQESSDFFGMSSPLEESECLSERSLAEGFAEMGWDEKREG
ncbi:MAG: hypothetical protein A2808_00315 [Candidatus Moranbacteria bacterium RIFCSPHIGHO2_01_FULL_55_24]|nr:MAG: hypothetical protein A2808_00315 [Candidatus Moranbacteria bacterium RIFCSPHIGHO2_01_FULL_55_24]